MFQLNAEEFKNLKSQFVISSWGGIRRARPYAFTEQGVAMLSSVLNSKRAVRVNIAIMRVFVRFRETLATHKELATKLAELEQRVTKHDASIQALFQTIHSLMSAPETPKKQIGFHVREQQAVDVARRNQNQQKGG